MVRKLIEWAVNSPLIVILLALTLVAVGIYSFIKVNVEAYPDPAPAIIEVVAQYPGASAEEVERQVTIPLEVTLAGMPGLKYTRSKSLFGLSHLRNQFDYGVDFYKARQEVINRLHFAEGLPPGVTPQLSPVTPTGELMRYTLVNPKDALGRDIYTLNDLKALQDWTLERQLRRIPGVIDVSSFGGTIKRYEINPDPDRLRQYGVTLQQLQNAIGTSNANAGGDYLFSGPNVLNIRGIGLIGGGQDPMQDKEIVGLENRELKNYLDTPPALPEEEQGRLRTYFAGGKLDPPLSNEEMRRIREIRARAAIKAAAILRAEEDRRLREIRQIGITAVNNLPVRVGHVVEGGSRTPIDDSRDEGVIIGHQTRLGKVSFARPKRPSDPPQVRADLDGWMDTDEKVMGIILLRKGEESLPTLQGIEEKVEEINRPGTLLPGVELEPHFDLTDLIHVTTETVRENLLLGMALVMVILLMFLNNIRSAIIVAINIPLALLFAFSVLFVRGKSANLLSIGAVDFGIIVDSTVIMVENIYRHLSSGEFAELQLKDRIIHATREVERSLFFSTVIMVCALLPLFTMQGPEGQIFGPMADTYAFALGGALLLALTLSPVLCLLFFRNLKPARDNFLVRWLKAGYLWQLNLCLNYRGIALGVVGLLVLITVLALPFLGQEFMPELEEGNFWIRGTFPVNASLDEVSDKVRRAREIIRRYPEVKSIESQIGRPDDGTDPTGFYNAEFSVPLLPEDQWPKEGSHAGPLAWLHPARRRTKDELRQSLSDDLNQTLIGVDWNFSQYIRDNVMECLSGVKGDNSVKIIGPDLDELDRLANRVKTRLEPIAGIKDVGVFRIKGQPNLEFPVDAKKCEIYGASKADVENVIQVAVGGKPFTQLIEGEKSFDVTLRWPKRLRSNEEAILNIPFDITNNNVPSGMTPSLPSTPLTGTTGGFSALGFSGPFPSLTGNNFFGANINNLSATPRRRLGDLVTPLDELGRQDAGGTFIRPGASTINREQGRRFIPVKFSVRGRDLASAVAEAQEKTEDLFQPPYHAEWSGEFQEMQEAEHRLLIFVSVSMALIIVLLYLAFHSLLDAAVILSNVLAASIGGIWALLLTGNNFNISAAVGFISILGVAIMNGLLMVSSFNHLRAQGVPLRESITRGVEKLVRPVTMTALAAIFGLLPAAFATRIGSQSQRPLAIAVVGGMIMTLLLANLVPVLYSFYGHRQPRREAGSLGH
jgi:cobalt-zinc-cadmium resistance protein CzcA